MSTTAAALSGTAIAEGLRALADMFEADPALAADRYIPDQAVGITVIFDSARDVVEFASRYGRDVERHENRTSAQIPLGGGSAPRYGIPSYVGAVVLTVSHIADEVSR
jgi:predicted fused transcriptional regulator/phosphomethylpyrimidine kinase